MHTHALGLTHLWKDGQLPYQTHSIFPIFTHIHAQETWEKRVSYIQVVVELVGAASHQKKTHIHSYSDPISHLFQIAVDVCVLGMWIHTYMHTYIHTYIHTYQCLSELLLVCGLSVCNQLYVSVSCCQP